MAVPILLLGDPAERVVSPLDRAGRVVDAGETADAHVAADGRVPGIGDVLGRGRGVLLGEQSAGIVVGQGGDDAAPVGDLGRLAQRVDDGDGGAGIGAGALDDVAEARCARNWSRARVVIDVDFISDELTRNGHALQFKMAIFILKQ